MSISEVLRAHGIVGAGGAGFPSYVKAQSRVEYILANGAECEPLLHKDARLMEAHPEKVVRGMMILADTTGAEHLVVGIKAKNQGAIAAMRAAAEGTPVTVFELQDYYPAGDEYELVHEITGRLIPAKGIPLHVGCITNNVETLYNIARAVDEGIPVTQKWITITGAVREPISLPVPIGITLRECLDLAGGVTIPEFEMSVDGIMMGHRETDVELRVTKTTGGIIVLPPEHYLMMRRKRKTVKMHQIGKSACDQCSFCTELCPRYMLGYDVQPHKVMRSLGFTRMGEGMWNTFADLCCSCGLCTLYACPEELYPKEACDRAKTDLRQNSRGWEGPREVTARPMKDARKVPVKSLMKRLKLTKYEHPAPYRSVTLEPDRVVLPLKMHVGVPAQPVVQTGDMVQAGQIIAQPASEGLGVALHASLAGRVTIVDGAIMIERQGL